MPWLRSIATWRKRFSRGIQEHDLDREIASHLELEAEEQQNTGLPADEARYAAQRAFGNSTLVKEDTREVWSWNSLERLQQDLRYAARTLRNNPGFATVTLLTLALGIGATTTMFSIVNTVLLRPLPFRDPDRLVMLEEKWLPRFPRFEASPLDFLSWQEQSTAFSDLAAFKGMAFNLTSDDRPEGLVGVRVSANLPSLLGVEPVLGRSFRPEEDENGNNRVVLLSHDLWHRRFGGDPRVIGSAVNLNDVAFTIVGVMPPGFRFPQNTEIWMPMGFTPKELESRGNHVIWAVARLKPGVTREQAQAEMDLLMPRLQKVWGANVVPLTEYYVGDVSAALLVLLSAAGLVLLIACANVANLLLARAAARQNEISLRAALGANRRRIIQQLLTETTLLAVLGGMLGLLLAFAGISVAKNLSPAGIPRFDEAALDYRVLLFALIVSALTGALFGLAPALRLSLPNLQVELKRSRSSGTQIRPRMRNALVVSEVALALVLLAGAGLLLKSFWNLLQVRIGVNPENVLIATINLPTVNYGESYRQNQFAQELVQRLRKLPEVRAAAMSTGIPLSSVGDSGIRFEGRPAGSPVAGTAANHYRVTPLYVQVMQIPLIRGRLFTDRDTLGSQPVVLINETMARRFFPDENPIGKRLDISGPTYMREIVGVVEIGRAHV